MTAYSLVLAALVGEMIRNSADMIKRAKGPMLPAIMLSANPAKPNVVMVVEEPHLADSVRKAREMGPEWAKKLDASAYVVAWDGYVTVGTGRSEAILMEAWQKPMVEPLKLAQRYQRDPFQLILPILNLDLGA